MAAIASFNLAELNGDSGFLVIGADAYDQSGFSVSGAGDINGDGIEDFLIGAPYGNSVGQAYVIFGRRGEFPATFNLDDLNGSNGFVLNGADIDERAGISVSSVGDVNGDGFDDFAVGAYYANGGGDNRSGRAYVVFGDGGSFAPSLNLSSLNGQNGFEVTGINSFDLLGRNLSSSDVNGDGVSDLLLGAPGADGNGTDSGQLYVVLGNTNLGSSGSVNVAGLNGSNGFVINGPGGGAQIGFTVQGTEDINADGVPDLIVGSRSGDSAYVVFGDPANTSSSFNLANLNGQNGFVLDGITNGGFSGYAVGSGDINDDGNADLIIGGFAVNNQAGATYVVFGGADVGSSGRISLADLDGTNGFTLTGTNAFDQLGWAVASGDINGDRIDDLIAAAPGTDPNSSNRDGGEVVVVFGQRGEDFPAAIATAELSGPDGFTFSFPSDAPFGAYGYDRTGSSVSVADVNGDGIDDVLIGARNADASGISDSGQTYVIYGSPDLPFPIDDGGGEAGLIDASDDTAITPRNQAITLDVLLNDRLVDAEDSLVLNFDTTSARGGTVTLDDNGTPDDPTDDRLVYTPLTGFAGSDTFFYTVEGFVDDGTGQQVRQTDSAQVTIEVNAPPVVSNFTRVEEEGETITFTPENFTEVFTDPEGDALESIRITDLTTLGRLELNGVAVQEGDEIATADLGGLVYIPPDEEFSGTDGFNWNGFDGLSFAEEEGFASLVIRSFDDAPDAINDTVETATGIPVIVPVLANDFDPDGGRLQILQGDSQDMGFGFEFTGGFTAGTSAQFGFVSFDDNGTPEDTTDDFLVYLAATNFAGFDTFTYAIDDALGVVVSEDGAVLVPVDPQEDTATVTIKVNNVTVGPLPNTNFTGNRGETVVVPIQLTQGQELQSADLTLTYDTSSLDLAPEDITLGSLTTGFGLEVNVQEDEGRVEIRLFNDNPLQLGFGSLVELAFQVPETATSGVTSRLDLVEVSLNDGAKPAFFSDGTVTIESFQVIEQENSADPIALNNSGFELLFNRPLQGELLNIFDGQVNTDTSSDLRLVGPDGSVVRGSAVWDGAQTVSFVRTGENLLAPGTYTLTLTSAADGFVSDQDTLLDGDGDGVPGGNFVETFTVPDSAATARVLSLPDFARGPGQEVAGFGGSSGLPIQLSDADGVAQVTFTLVFDPEFLTVTGVDEDSLPTGWTAETVDLDFPGRATITLVGDPLTGDAITLVNLEAAVPGAATYGSGHIVDLRAIAVEDGAGESILTLGDAAVHQVAFLGDVSGNEAYTSLDASLVSRVAVGLDTGFDAFALLDPVVIGDTSGNGRVQGNDAAQIARVSAGLTVNSIPPLV